MTKECMSFSYRPHRDRNAREQRRVLVVTGPHRELDRLEIRRAVNSKHWLVLVQKTSSSPMLVTQLPN